MSFVRKRQRPEAISGVAEETRRSAPASTIIFDTCLVSYQTHAGYVPGCCQHPNTVNPRHVASRPAARMG